MHTLLVTAAGLSTRYPGGLPKWAMCSADGRAMGSNAVRGLIGFTRLVVVVGPTARAFSDTEVGRMFATGDAPLPEVCRVEQQPSQAASAAAGVIAADVTGPMTIRDCDSRFEYTLRDEDAVACVDLHDAGLVHAANKSYALTRAGTADVVCLAERRIISALFCCGAYSFADARAFLDHAHVGPNVSDVINALTRGGRTFRARVVAGTYVDLGTYEDWLRAGGKP